MDDRQENSFGRLVKADVYLNNHQAAFSPVPQVAAEQANLQSIIDAIVTEAGLGKLAGDAALAKGNQRELTTKVFTKVTRAAAAYFLSKDDVDNQKRVTFAKSQISGLRDGVFYITVKTIITFLAPFAADLSNFNSGPADLVNLNKANEDFFKLIQAPQRDIETRAMHNDNIDPLLAEGSAIIKKLTTYISTFAASDEDLLDGWLLAIQIIDTGSIQSPDDTIPVTIAAGAVVNIALDDAQLAGSSEAGITNNGPVVAAIDFSDNNSTVGTTPILQNPNAYKRYSFNQLGFEAASKRLLNIKNNGAEDTTVVVEIYY